MKICEPANMFERKRQLTDVYGLIRPHKSKKVEAGKALYETKPMSSKKAFETLSKEPAEAGCNKASTPTTTPWLRRRHLLLPRPRRWIRLLPTLSRLRAVVW